jgi:multidrug efflux pump subunit AcrB
MVEPTFKSSARERFNISRLAIQYSWLTISFWIAIVVAGILAFSSLKYALFPDITFPVVVVNASAAIDSAQETEKVLTKPIEERLATLPGKPGIDSTTYPGQVIVSTQFDVGTNLKKSAQNVENALKGLKLPKGASYKILSINLNEAAVSSYVIDSSSKSLKDLTQVTKDKIVPAIAKLPGVLSVNVLGEPVTFDLTKLTNPEAAFTQAGTIIRFNGQRALAVQAVKQGDANTLEVARAVDKVMQQLRSQLPDVKITLAATQATYIRAATQETIHALIEAIVIAVVVIFPFLWSWRAMLISAIAIPISLLATFIVMATYGFNLETITLLALGMIVGSIVDDAIVDVENISRHLELGESPRQAAIAATNEIGLTVTAATLTVVAVFLPVAMMGGVLGQFFKPFGITVSAAMIASLLVARTLSPILAMYWLKPKRAAKPELSDSPQPTEPQSNWLSGINNRYRNLLHWSLEHRWLVVGISTLSFAIGLALIPLIPKGFIPKLDRGEFNITYTAPPPEIPPELQAALAQQAAAQNPAAVQQAAAAQKSAGGANQLPPGLAAGQRPPQAPLPSFNPLDSSLKAAEQLDQFILKSPYVEDVFTTVGSREGEPNKGKIYVQLKANRTLDTASVQDELRKSLPALPGVKTSIEDIQFVDTGGEKPVQIRLIGDDLLALSKAALDLKARLQKIPGLEDISTTADDNRGNTIQAIYRDGGQRTSVVSANLGQNLTIGEATDRAVAEAKAILPRGVSLDLGGDSAQVNEILSSFGTTLALALVCVVLVLFALFKNWIDTLVVFLSLPLSIIGAMLGLLIVQSDFGMISLLGIIFLLGLTNKNAILIVDYINQLRCAGKSRSEAILEAGPIRLRPILMTTAATILGMLPLALGFGAGVELRAPMAVAIMGGLVTSTVLSLVVVPVLYDLLDDWQARFLKRKC